MSAWAVKNYAGTLDSICDRAWAGEPQFVTRGSMQTVVVISYVDYRRNMQTRPKATDKKPNLLLNALRSCPFGDDLAVAISDRNDSVPSYFERWYNTRQRILVGRVCASSDGGE